MPAIARRSLAEQSKPEHLTIRRVRDEDGELLRHLKKLGLLPGTAIEFVTQEPFGGAYVIRVGDEIVRVAPRAAEQIFVGAPSEV
jgi:Fe2+ transport system protein FeoA